MTSPATAPPFPVTYAADLDVLDADVARFTVDQVPLLVLQVPRADWVPQGRPSRVYVTVTVE